MKGRAFITGLVGTAAWPLGALAQKAERSPHIGVLMGNAESDVEGKAGVAAFRDELRPDWLKFKNPAAPAVRREVEKDWGGRAR
jgi:hypothetical protein